MAHLLGVGESLGDVKGDTTGEENGAAVVWYGLRTKDLRLSAFRLVYKITKQVHVAHRTMLATEVRLQNSLTFP